MPNENDPPTWPLLATIITTTALGLAWVYAGTTMKRQQALSPVVSIIAPIPTVAKVADVSRDFCDKMRRDIANDVVEFDRDSALDMAMLNSWDVDCRSRFGFSIMK